MGVIKCAGCGYKVNEAAVACPDCGADPRSGATTGEPPASVAFRRASFLGYMPELKDRKLTAWNETFHVTPEWIGTGPSARVRLVDVKDVQVAGSNDRRSFSEMAKDAAGTVIMTGAIGLLFTQTTVDRTLVVVNTREGEAVCFGVDDQRDGSLRSAIRPILEQAGIPLT